MKLKTLLVSLVFCSQLYAVDRPDLEIAVKTHFICDEGSSLTGPQYDNFCKNENRPYRTLYVVFEPSVNIMLNVFNTSGKTMAGVYHWCNSEIVGDDRTGPSCALVVSNKNTRTRVKLDVTTQLENNLVEVNLSALDKNTTYNAQMVETGSGSFASTMPFILVNP